MKKLFSVSTLVLAFGFAYAQQATGTVTATGKPALAAQGVKTSTKVNNASANAKGTVSAKANTKTAVVKEPARTTGVKLKKDGTPDKRYKNAPASQHLKKDGTPDKRFKENK